MEKKIIIGAGGTTKALINYMNKIGYCFYDIFFACMDNNSNLWGKEIEGIPIISLQEVFKYPNTELVISSIYEKELKDQLIQMGCHNLTISVEDYKRELFTNYQYSKYLEAHPENKPIGNCHIDELTVYTVIFGRYDSLCESMYKDKRVKYVCYTDDRTIQSDVWEVRYVDREYENPILESRKYKLLPHKFIEKDYSIYIDANVRFDKSPLDYLNTYLLSEDMLFIPHEARDCVYEEVACCLLGERDSAQRLIHQAYTYCEDGCPQHSGLFWGGLIGRKHTSSKTIAFNEEWWEQFKKYSYRDQISLGYLIWKNNPQISLANIDCRRNQWFHVREHIKR